MFLADVCHRLEDADTIFTKSHQSNTTPEVVICKVLFMMLHQLLKCYTNFQIPHQFLKCYTNF